jgi:hypothetical protein
MQTSRIERALNRRLAGISEQFLQLRVFAGGPSNEPDNILETFVLQAAPFLRTLLTEPPLTNVGVGWGWTVFQTVRIFERDGRPTDSNKEIKQGKRPIQFIPTCGEQLSDRRATMSSTGIAYHLDWYINSDDEHRGGHHLSLRGVPARIPDDTPPKIVGAIREFILRRSEGWRRIFSGKDPLAENLDAIITSLAPIKQKGRRFPDELVSVARINRKELGRRVEYDIGGVLVPRNDGDELVARWNNFWTGIKLDHYKKCSSNACRSRSPGVVVLAVGENKGKVLLDAVRNGYVNTIVIDETLGDSLLRLLERKSP